MVQKSSNAPLARVAMAYVLAGGRGSRLMELTDVRAKPAAYFGGNLRIIDFALSNALNSGIRRQFPDTTSLRKSAGSRPGCRSPHCARGARNSSRSANGGSDYVP
jgi:hypothetical protein